MEWVLGIVAAILGLGLIFIVVLVLVGLFMPKGHVARRTVNYEADPETVWNVITDWPNHPTWRSSVRSLERLPDRNGHAVWRENRRRGDKLTQEVVELDPSQRQMVTMIVDESSFGGSWGWQVAPAPDGQGSLFTITERGEIYNPIFRVIGAWFMDVRATMDGVHRDLKAKLGEHPPMFDD